MRMFLDTEFTHLTQETQLISIALVSECGKSFYAVVNNFKLMNCSDFVKTTVLPFLELKVTNPLTTYIKGGEKEILVELNKWLSQFNKIEMWADVPHYDWVLFCELFGGALHIPKHIHYICRDLATLLETNGFDINKSRLDFINKKELPNNYIQHNALSDAQVGIILLQKLTKNELS